MRKRILSFCLSVFLLFFVAVPVCAVEVETVETVITSLTISTAEEFLQFAEACRLDAYSQNLQVNLKKDIDLTGLPFSGIPIFSGCFDGNGHSISGVSIHNDGSMQGLFRYLTADAIVKNLSVIGQVHPGGSRNEIGAIAGRNEGQILNCKFTGNISGSDYVGGIAGINAVTGIIDNCIVSGDMHGDHFVGGVAGENRGVIRNCVNHAQINTTPQQNSVELSDITLDTLTNTESANTVTDIGGIAGISSGVIRSCANHADVGYQHMGFNIGGIAGTQSGYIANCENHGNIQGRKEIGGIVGQMEPAALIEYSEDALQILEDQLGTMSGLVNQASGNAHSNANQIIGQLGVLQDQTETARDAVETLIPRGENPELPDTDTILAAQNTLSTTLNAMHGTLRTIVSSTQNTMNTLTRDLNAISAQVGAMGETVSHASENLGGTISDLSDQDTPDLLSCKVESCVNFGNILADLNAGGISGAISLENDLDVLEDLEQQGSQSLNFQSSIRAVILNCKNSGTVTGIKQNVGGIVGGQIFGLVKNSVNTGTIDGKAADYVGGISGISTGFIRNNQVKAQICGKTYVGGIAGSGTIVTDSLVHAKFSGVKELLGAVLGFAAESYTEDPQPIAGNYYLSMEQDPGAIDGISYAGIAEPKALEDFLCMENLPELFRTVSVRFVADHGTVQEIILTPGGKLQHSQIPKVPKQDGFVGQWDGLAETDMDHILFDMTFDAVYTAHSAVIASTHCRENGLPILLAEGSFTKQAAVSVSESTDTPVLTRKETLLESWTIRINEIGSTLRFQLPADTDPEQVKLYVSDSDGNWQEVTFHPDGRYLVFPCGSQHMQLALVQEASSHTGLLIGGCAIVSCVAVLLFIHKKKKHSNPA